MSPFDIAQRRLVKGLLDSLLEHFSELPQPMHLEHILNLHLSLAALHPNTDFREFE